MKEDCIYPKLKFRAIKMKCRDVCSVRVQAAAYISLPCEVGWYLQSRD